MSHLVAEGIVVDDRQEHELRQHQRACVIQRFWSYHQEKTLLFM
jgi:hypothetical protein